jgi:peptide/nickel transport system substrate-binding protein
MAVLYEPPVLTPKNVESTGRLEDQIRLFNASLALLDARGAPLPYLAEALPELHSATWRLLPDGAMETIYRLGANLRWHDGTPLSAEDFVLAWRVYSDPALGLFVATPQDKMETVLAPDPRTVVVRWRMTYPDAGALRPGELEPLPRHVLEAAFAAYEQDPPAQREAFANHPYWKTDYVGLGPYRLERWEPGTLIEAVAFDGHALGRAKIDRIVMRFITDDNTVLANMLAESLHLALRSVRFEQGMALKRGWAASKRGVVLLMPNGTNTAMIQMRGEFLKVPELLDPRVRGALAHAIDREALNEGVFEGQGLMSETYITPEAPYYAELDRSITKHPYDVRQSEQLMTEAGLVKGRDGFYERASGDRLTVPYLVVGGTEYERHGAIMTDTWRRAGYDIQQSILPAVQMRDNHARASFPAILHNPLGAGEKAAAYFTAAQAGTAANRWGGNNRGGWSNPEYERLYEGFTSTLDRSERDRQIVQMMVMLNRVLPAFQLYFRFDTVAHLSELRGPGVVTPESRVGWNVHEWELGH